ncbi:FAD-binding oxidoreductase [Sphingopyxis sp.]|uniref:FAD-binding oxidoreductase n=1 Tax=Sphingopyxis sp. TaxID=1908224 RepID=UPI002613EA91|nr:FAD-binding oxidoreductase [Sphingopyxis sp.]MCW0197511.1 FAD-binding oxidoreductase [Sphingopyxis sp.]
MVRKRWVVGGVAAASATGAAIWAAPLAADPDGIKDCGPEVAKLAFDKVQADAAAEPDWVQAGGTINDESCLSRTAIRGIVAPATEAQLADTLAYARANTLPVTAAGAKHSMGGQAFAKGGVVIDMRRMNAVRFDREARTITVGAGARWHDIQNKIHPEFAIKAMQSTDVFTVGGSIAVNAHGMDHRAGAMMGSIRALRVMLADGRVVTASREENPDLFRHVVGGYGLFGIVTEATLDVVPNDIYQSSRAVIATKDFPKTFAALEADPDIGLTYTHLSTAPGSLLEEALVYRYTKVPDEAGLERAPLSEVGAVKLRRLTVNMSKRADWLKSLKWWTEKNIEHRIESCTVTRAQAMRDGEACLVSRNDPMHDSVPYLYNDLRGETDILHEYFVPRAALLPFVADLRAVFKRRKTNLLNASIRAVEKEENALSYAPEPAFSVVLYINQPTDAAGNAEMDRLTRELIDLTAKHGGRFFLPYQLHYSGEQLRRAYPEFDAFVVEKRKWDPEGLFRNRWYDRYAEST